MKMKEENINEKAIHTLMGPKGSRKGIECCRTFTTESGLDSEPRVTVILEIVVYYHSRCLRIDWSSKSWQSLHDDNDWPAPSPI